MECCLLKPLDENDDFCKHWRAFRYCCIFALEIFPYCMKFNAHNDPPSLLLALQQKSDDKAMKRVWRIDFHKDYFWNYTHPKWEDQSDIFLHLNWWQATHLQKVTNFNNFLGGWFCTEINKIEWYKIPSILIKKNLFVAI